MILVFKTDIETNTDIETVSPVLCSFDEIKSWTIDNVLRIDSTIDITDSVEYSLNHSGYVCLELE